MITLHSDFPAGVFIGIPGAELGFTNAGTWPIPSTATYVNASTNTADLTGLRDGASILVDAGANIQVANGPDLVLAAVYGFAMGFGVVGLLLMTRWAARVFFGRAGIQADL